MRGLVTAREDFIRGGLPCSGLVRQAVSFPGKWYCPHESGWSAHPRPRPLVARRRQQGTISGHPPFDPACGTLQRLKGLYACV